MLIRLQKMQVSLKHVSVLVSTHTCTNSNTCSQTSIQILSQADLWGVLAVSVVNICRVRASWFTLLEVGYLFSRSLQQTHNRRNCRIGATMRQRIETCCAIGPTGVSHWVLRETFCSLWVLNSLSPPVIVTINTSADTD